jgi:acetyl esterase/lipase
MSLLRFLGGCLFLGLAALTAVPAPHAFLWKASIAATEWGYWLAFAAVLPLIPTRDNARVGKLGAVMSVGAIVLFLVPVLRAHEMNQVLPRAFDATFGEERRERAHFAEGPRPEPLVLPDLVKPLPLPMVRFEERQFGTVDGQPLTLDVYRPAYEHGPLPGVIVVHGAGWQPGDDNTGFVALNAYLASRDYVVAAINYRVAPKYPFPAGRDDVLSAIAYLKVFGPQFGLDPTRIALLGRSEGGQLALLAAYTAQEPAIRGVISIYGSTDLRFGYEHPAPSGILDTRGVLEAYLGGPPKGQDDTYFYASPINFVSASSPPTLLIHGLRDDVVSAEQSARLDARLQQANVKHLFVRLPWATHGCDKSFGGPCGQIATYAVERFLDSVMIGRPAPEKTRTRPAGRTRSASASTARGSKAAGGTAP